MRSDLVVVATPGFDDDLRLGATPEPFERQAFVAELAVEAIVVTVLPRLSGVDVGGLDLLLGEPLQDCLTDELRAVVRAQEARCTVLGDEPGEDLDDATRADQAGNVDRQALPGEFVDDGEAFELLAVGTGIEHEIVGPDMVGSCRRQRPRAGCRYRSGRTPALKLQPGVTPQSVRPVAAHGVSFASQKHSNPPVSLARVLCRQPLHRRHGRGIPLGPQRALSQSRAGDFHQLASAPLRIWPRSHASATCSRRACELTTFGS